jgi:hypothetical protein
MPEMMMMMMMMGDAKVGREAHQNNSCCLVSFLGSLQDDVLNSAHSFNCTMGGGFSKRAHHFTRPLPLPFAGPDDVILLVCMSSPMYLIGHVSH